MCYVDGDGYGCGDVDGSGCGDGYGAGSGDDYGPGSGYGDDYSSDDNWMKKFL